MNIYIGWDNGVTGSVGILGNGIAKQFPMPTKSCLNYQKTKVKHITRIDIVALRKLLKLETTFDAQYQCADVPITMGSFCKALVERPMISPQRFEATTSALRALEVVLIILEEFDIGYNYVDSKAWQKVLLPNVTGEQYNRDKSIYKKLSLEVGKRMFPSIDFHKDADGILIAKYCQMYWEDKQ